jgi:hypothetical protein
VKGTSSQLHVVGVSADSMDIARGIGERDGEAFSDRSKTGVQASLRPCRSMLGKASSRE